MALIGKIRKNFWFVLLVLGLALAAFVVMDMTSAGGMSGQAAQLIIGEVNGEKLKWDEFQRTEQVYFGNTGGDIFQKREALWNYYVEKAIVDNEADGLGLKVSKDELMDLQFGQNLSPVIQQNWRNPQTGQLDIATLQQYKQAIENNQPLDPSFREFWAEQERQIIKTQLEDKWLTMVSKAVYTPALIAEQGFKDQNTMVDFNYVKIPFDQINEDVNLTDADFSDYIEKNAKKYSNTEPTRDIQYLKIDVYPTSEDTSLWKDEILSTIEDFKATDNDSLFAYSNEGFYSNIYFKPDDLTDTIKSFIEQLDVGEVYGPFIESGNYRALKLIDKRVVPDSVKARHILKAVTAGNTEQLASARSFIDSLKNVLNSRAVSFDSLALKHSDDTNSKIIGGDLGTFEQGRMVPAFNNVCFLTGRKGGLYTVETQFGVHLLEVNNQIYNNRDPKYKVAFVAIPIIPSQQTQDLLLDNTSELVASYPYLNDLIEGVADREDIIIETVNNLKRNDYLLGAMGGGNTSRDIIKWAFSSDADINSVSPEVHIYTDPVNYFNSSYVITGLYSINEKGLQSIESLKDELEPVLTNIKKAEALVSTLKSKSMEDIASEFNLEIDSLRKISLNSSFTPGLGNEPLVMGALSSLELNAVSEPIIGNSGVFVVTPTEKSEVGDAMNIPQLRNLESLTTRSQLALRLMEDVRKRAKIKDDRYTYY